MFPLVHAERVGRQYRPLIDRLAAGAPIRPATEPVDLAGYVDMALLGGYPRPTTQLDGLARRAWIDSYVAQAVSRDAPGVGRKDADGLRRYFEAYALHSGGIVDQIDIARDAGIDRKTGVEYENLFDRMMLTAALPAWSTNRLKRLVRTPKRFMVDGSLMSGILRLDTAGVLRDGRLLGRVIETLVVAQLRPEQVVGETRPRLFHLRQQQGRREVDVIGAHRVVGIEIKAGGAPDRDDARHLIWLREELGERFVAGVVLHTGPKVYEIDESIVAAPISTLWAER